MFGIGLARGLRGPSRINSCRRPRTRTLSILPEQRGGDRQIGCGEIVAGQFVGQHPRDGDMFSGLRFRRARDEMADERNHLNRGAVVGMGEPRQRTDHADLAIEFLPDLAKEGGFGGLARFHLAAGELPFEGQVLVPGSLGEQHAPAAFDHGGDHKQGRGILMHEPGYFPLPRRPQPKVEDESLVAL